MPEKEVNRKKSKKEVSAGGIKAVKVKKSKTADDKKLTVKQASLEKPNEETGAAKDTILVDSVTQDRDEAQLAEIKHEEKTAGHDRYFEGVGRRKTAVARVRLFTKAGDFLVNNKPYGAYFPTLELQKIADDSLQKMKLSGRFRISAKVFGGGIHAQAEALRHGLARCLVKFNLDFRKRLKRAGYLKRDPRMKERKKFGLKKARRAPQWRKR